MLHTPNLVSLSLSLSLCLCLSLADAVHPEGTPGFCRGWTLEGFDDLDQIPRSVTVTSPKPGSASAGCCGPKVIIMGVEVLPQRKLGKVIRWSIRVY